MRGLGAGPGRQRSGLERNLNFGNHWHLGTEEEGRKPWRSVGGGGGCYLGSPPAGLRWPWPAGQSQGGRRGALRFHSSRFSHQAQPLAKDQNPALGLTPNGNSMPGRTEWEPRSPCPRGYSSERGLPACLGPAPSLYPSCPLCLECLLRGPDGQNPTDLSRVCKRCIISEPTS